MSREWTEQHILELITKNSKGSKTSLYNDLHNTAGLEFKMSYDYNGLRSRDSEGESNIRRVNISVPSLSPALQFNFAEMKAGEALFPAPIELTIALNSPFQQFNPNGFIGYISKAKPAHFQVTGGWLTDGSYGLDPTLIYPDITVDIMDFNGKSDDSGHTLHVSETTMQIYPDLYGYRDQPFTIPVYRLSVTGATKWPDNGFHFHKLFALGVKE